jgi:N-acetylneuraminic acid mutarotase
MLQPRTRASAAVVVNKMYVIGGNVSSETDLIYSEIYDPNTDTWQVLNMPDFADKRPWQQLGTANVETRIYILGGRRGDQLLNSHYVYTPFIYNTYIPAAAAEDQK